MDDLWNFKILWLWGFGWVDYANKWAFGSILNAYIKWNVEYSMRLVVALFWVCWAKIRSFKGETNVYKLDWGIWFHCGEKRRCVCTLGAYSYVTHQL